MTKVQTAQHLRFASASESEALIESPHEFRWLVVVLAASLSGCALDPNDSASGIKTEAACLEPRSQALSEPCCLAHGIDACGSGLFCAAFDGRKQPTCYPNQSRADMAECTAHLQCSSGDCNRKARKCRSSPTAGCEKDVGCVDDYDGNHYVCDPRAKHTCQPAGVTWAYCKTDAECDNRSCGTNGCRAPLEADCEVDDDCVSRSCDPYYLRCIPSCDVATSNCSGVGCKSSTDCESNPETPVCRKTTGECVQCLDRGDCSAGQECRREKCVNQ